MSDQARAAALVLFSGGQDSTTCLAWALDRFERVETIGFAYGQRHQVELDSRGPIRDRLGERFPRWGQGLGQDHMLRLDALAEISDTALTREVAIAIGANGLPNTFVPGRNLVFLSFAAAVAYRRGLGNLVIGVCETDYSGYPDCRDDAVKAMQVALNLGMQSRFVAHAPLMFLNKAATWRLAHDLGGPLLVDLVRVETQTCYNGDRTALHDWGYGCGACPACDLRSRGYRQYVQARPSA